MCDPYIISYILSIINQGRNHTQQIENNTYNNGMFKCSKIPNTFLFLFWDKVLVFMAEIHKMLVRIANREDPDQTASSEEVWSGSALFV